MAASSSLLEVQHIHGKGRGLIASQNLKAGQIILTESPITLYSAFPLISQSSSSYCNHCFSVLPSSSSSPSHTIFSCPSCSLHRFCSHGCLSIALKSSHSPWICQSLSLLSASPLLLQQPQELQVQARFVLAAYNLTNLQIQTLLSLMGTPDESLLEASKFLHSLISSLCPPHPLFHDLSVDLIAQLLAKDRLNSFCLMEPYSPHGPQRSIKAYAIYPKSTFFNHDCLPNACRFDHVRGDEYDEHKTDIVFRMIKDVPKGGEVCISYFRMNRDYGTRKRILMQDYGFVCECERCKIEANWDENGGDFPHAWFLSKYVCDRMNCSGTMAPLPPKDDDDNETPSNVQECNFCGNLKTDDVA